MLERTIFLVLLSVWILDCCSKVIVEDELERLILSGRVSMARRHAYEYLQDNPTREVQKSLSNVYVAAFEKALEQHGDNFSTEIVKQATMLEDSRDLWHHHVKHDDEKCIPVPTVNENMADSKVSSLLQWDHCCSILPTIIHSGPASDSILPILQENSATPTKQGANDCPIAHPCCSIFPGSLSYLKLPLLQEPIVSVRIHLIPDLDQPFIEKILQIEQEAYLRPFDPGGVLWPTGYLLSQCGLGDKIHEAWSYYRERNIGRPFAIELGAGLGAPSIALSLLLDFMQASEDRTASHVTKPLVTTAEVAQSALAAAVSNSYANGASVGPLVLNHFNISEVKSHISFHGGGYSLILGSSLQSFFDNGNDPTSILWKVLDILLDRHNPHALAIFAHGKSALVGPEDGSFELIHQISGDQFSMKTLWGESSDFEIFVFRRGRKSMRTDDEL